MGGRIIFSSVGPGVDQRYVRVPPGPDAGSVKARGDERNWTARTALAGTAAVDVDLFEKFLPGQADLVSLGIHSPAGNEDDTRVRPGPVVLGEAGGEAVAAEMRRRLEACATSFSRSSSTSPQPRRFAGSGSRRSRGQRTRRTVGCQIAQSFEPLAPTALPTGDKWSRRDATLRRSVPMSRTPRRPTASSRTAPEEVRSVSN